MPNDLLSGLLKATTAETQDEILMYASEPLVEKTKENLAMHKDTGELQNSIKSVLKKTKDGVHYVVATPTGKSKKHFYGGKNHDRKYELTNAGKFIFMEYGTPKQPATPILEKTQKDAENEVVERLQSKLNEVIGD